MPLNKNIPVEDRVWKKLNTKDYEDSESDTDYSDESDFKSRYGYWNDDSGETESEDESDHDEKMDSDVDLSLDKLC